MGTYVNIVAHHKVPHYRGFVSETSTPLTFCVMGRCTKEVPPKPTASDYYSKNGDPSWTENYPLLYPDQPLRFYCLINDSFDRYTHLYGNFPCFTNGSHLEIMRYLVTECGADVNLHNPLKCAIGNKDLAAADLLLELGAHCDEDTACKLEKTRAVVAEGPPVTIELDDRDGNRNHYKIMIKPGMTVREVKENLAKKAGIERVENIWLKDWKDDSATFDSDDIWKAVRSGLEATI